MEDQEWGRAVIPEANTAGAPLAADAVEEVEEEVEVAIVGGGLAGLAVAIGLTRAGIPCKVYERAPKLRSSSQGVLSVEANGLAALATIHPDLPQLVAQKGNQNPKVIFESLKPSEEDGGNSIQGTKIEKPDTGEESVQKFGYVRVVITWHGMQQVLASLLPPDVVVTSRSLASFEDSADSDGIVLKFLEDHQHGNGSEKSTTTTTIMHSVKAKAVLACDGVFSVARRQLLAAGNNDNDKDAPIYFGQLNWGTVLPTNQFPQDALPPKKGVHVTNYTGTDPALWMSMVIDAGQDNTFWQFRVSDPVKAMSLSPTKGRGGLGLGGVKESLLPIVATTSPTLKAIIEATPESQIFERSIVGRLPATTWINDSGNGRLALVGDAAHGMHPRIGQGGNSSFESAAEVVRAMKEEWMQKSQSNQEPNMEPDWPKALRAFQDRRKPKADLVQQFCNYAGCNQATGQNLNHQVEITPEVHQQIMDWIYLRGTLEEFPASQQVLDALKTFDLLAQPGVSKIL